MKAMTEESHHNDPTRRWVDELLLRCVRMDASDLHLAAGLQPYWRLNGVLGLQGGEEPTSDEQMHRIAAVLLAGVGDRRLAEVGDQDGAISSSAGTRFRFNIFRRQNRLAIAFRRLEERFRSLADLGLPASLYNLCDLMDGLVIVAGPTGAGKSTTLATLLHRVNTRRHGHIVTIEDPIEYLHAPIQSLVNQRQVGADARSFNDALVASLRQDPDVILVGEVRDLDTIRTAITAAETGHLVLTTVHAGDCVGAIERLVSVFPADEQHGIRRQLSLVLRAIVAQHLLVADGEQVDRPADPDARPRRVVASEVLYLNSAVANLIATGKTAQIYSAMETGAAVGMQTLEQDLARLWSSGVISEATAKAMARHPGIVLERAGRMRPAAARSPMPSGGGPR